MITELAVERVEYADYTEHLPVVVLGPLLRLLAWTGALLSAAVAAGAANLVPLWAAMLM